MIEAVYIYGPDLIILAMGAIRKYCNPHFAHEPSHFYLFKVRLERKGDYIFLTYRAKVACKFFHFIKFQRKTFMFPEKLLARSFCI